MLQMKSVTKKIVLSLARVVDLRYVTSNLPEEMRDIVAEQVQVAIKLLDGIVREHYGYGIGDAVKNEIGANYSVGDYLISIDNQYVNVMLYPIKKDGSISDNFIFYELGPYIKKI